MLYNIIYYIILYCIILILDYINIILYYIMLCYIIYNSPGAARGRWGLPGGRLFMYLCVDRVIDLSIYVSVCAFMH